MTRARYFLVAALVTSPALVPAPWSIARAEQQPSVVPGEQGGDPKPDTELAERQLRAGRYEDAISSAKRALGRDERHVPAMIVMAKSYYGLHKYELATSIVDIAKGIDPNVADGYNLLGFIAISRNDKVSATAAFKKAVELKPDFGNAWNNLAAQYLEAKNYDGAVEAAEKATQLLPNFAKAWLNLGSAYRGKARYGDAEAAYRKAIGLNANYPEAYFNLGILYLDAPQWPGLDVQGKLGVAIGHLTRYRDLMASRLPDNDPADGYVEEAKKAIDREKKRLERAAKQKDRDKAKAPTGTTGSTTTVTPPPGSGDPGLDAPPK